MGYHENSTSRLRILASYSPENLEILMLYSNPEQSTTYNEVKIFIQFFNSGKEGAMGRTMTKASISCTELVTRVGLKSLKRTARWSLQFNAA